MMDFVYAVGVMGVLGLVIGVGLAVASKVFYVYVDPLVAAVDDALPGANCGGCGLPGCGANAEAIVAGKAAPNSCVAGGEDLANAIAGLLGVSVEAKEPDIALPGCTYGVSKADTKYIYDGLNSCRAVSLLSGGIKICNIGCLGLGTCAEACPFDAIAMGPEGLPVIDEEKCTGCGTCEKVCPKHIINLSSVTRRIIKEYTTNDCTTPCQRACPAGIDISKYIGLIATGEYHQAIQTIKERNPFPTIIGRICPRPCENDCRRRLIDEPVAINFLKRFAADYEREIGKRVLPFKAPATERKIAIIGGGIEGLSTAFFSARLGHDPTVFEATSQLGGLLRSAIALNRLPQDVLDWDIEGIKEMGVNVEMNKVLGKDITIDSLFRDGFESVFLASGGWDNRLSRGTGLDVESLIPGFYLLIDLIKQIDNSSNKILCEDDVVIAGGDKLIVQAVDACKNLGAKHITVLLRETKDLSTIEDSEIKAIQEKGAEIIFDAGINRVKGEGNKLSAIEYVEFGSGRKNSIPAKTLFISSGRFPELVFVRSEKPDENQESTVANDVVLTWEGVEVIKPTAAIQEQGLMSNMSALTDFSAAIKAIAAGRRGAASIHQVMYDIPLFISDNILTQTSFVQNVDHVEGVKPSARQIMPLCTDISKCNELEVGFTKEMAKIEADRCLRCGLVCYKKVKTDTKKPKSEDTVSFPAAYQFSESNRIQ